VAEYCPGIGQKARRHIFPELVFHPHPVAYRADGEYPYRFLLCRVSFHVLFIDASAG